MIQEVKINQNDNERLAEKMNEMIKCINKINENVTYNKKWIEQILDGLPGGPGFG